MYSSEVGPWQRVAQQLITHLTQSPEVSLPPHLEEIKVATQEHQVFQAALNAEIDAQLARANEQWEKEWPTRAQAFREIMKFPPAKETPAFIIALNTLLSRIGL